MVASNSVGSWSDCAPTVEGAFGGKFEFSEALDYDPDDRLSDVIEPRGLAGEKSESPAGEGSEIARRAPYSPENPNESPLSDTRADSTGRSGQRGASLAVTGVPEDASGSTVADRRQRKRSVKRRSSTGRVGTNSARKSDAGSDCACMVVGGRNQSLRTQRRTIRHRMRFSLKDDRAILALIRGGAKSKEDFLNHSLLRNRTVRGIRDHMTVLSFIEWADRNGVPPEDVLNCAIFSRRLFDVQFRERVLARLERKRASSGASSSEHLTVPTRRLASTRDDDVILDLIRSRNLGVKGVKAAAFSVPKNVVVLRRYVRKKAFIEFVEANRVFKDDIEAAIRAGYVRHKSEAGSMRGRARNKGRRVPLGTTTEAMLTRNWEAQALI